MEHPEVAPCSALSPSTDPVNLLPPELAVLVLQHLSVAERLRARVGSKAWRDLVNDARVWEVCNLSLEAALVSPERLLATTQLAQGRLRELDLTGCRQLLLDDVEDRQGPPGIADRMASTLERVLPVLRANSGALLELRLSDCGSLSTAHVEELLAAAPNLRVLECDVFPESEETADGRVPRLLLEPQFERMLRLRSFTLRHVSLRHPPPDVPALVARLAQHKTLRKLTLLLPLDSELALGAVVDLALSQLTTLSLVCGELSPDSLPALTRLLLADSPLTELRLYEEGLLYAGAALPAFCAALKASRLEVLVLGMNLWHSVEGGLAVLAACTAHPTLRALFINANDVMDDGESDGVVSAALAGLVAAPGSSVELLDISSCMYGDAVMRVFFEEGVAHSSRLLSLQCAFNGMSGEGAEGFVLPAVRRNTSLRELSFQDEEVMDVGQGEEPFRQAAQLVASRPADARFAAVRALRIRMAA